MHNSFKLSVCQMKVSQNKQENVNKAVSMIEAAAKNGSELVILPEMFNCPYDNSKFREFSESVENGPTINAVCDAAGNNGIYVAAGSIPEYSEGKLYNTCALIGKDGKIIAKHRKVHLFDIDVEGRITFKESDVLARGDRITVADTELCKIGVAICFDIRFPELFRIMALKGANLIIVPGAFNMVTGPVHWELLLRSRAVDNQVFLAAASPARDMDAGYIAYGNSMVVDPWGSIIGRASDGEEIITCEIDFNQIDKIRSQLPLIRNLRSDIYEICEKQTT